jgi:hypothetical protein
MAKRKLKIGTIIEFSFAGQILMGEIKAIKVDMGYSVRSEWYTVHHKDGTIYPLRIEDESINIIKPKHNK